MKSFRRFVMWPGAWLSFQTAALAELKLPAIFGDSMALQQQQAAPVWGRAAADGKWLVELAKPVAVRFAWSEIAQPNLAIRSDCLPSRSTRSCRWSN